MSVSLCLNYWPLLQFLHTPFAPFPFWLVLCLFTFLVCLLPMSSHSLPRVQGFIFLPCSNASSHHPPFCLLPRINQPFWLHQALSPHLDKFKSISSGFLIIAPENYHLPFSLFFWTWDEKSQTSVGGVSNTLTSKGPGVGREAMMVILWKSTSLSNNPMDSIFLLFVLTGIFVI